MNQAFQRRLLDALEGLYDRLANVDPARPRTNACGTCRTCCTARGVDRQVVTELELGLLARHYGPERAQDFRRFANRERGPDGQFTFDPCPNLGPAGCSVYAHRPFSCRVFGHYRLEHTRLPDECHFRGSERSLPHQDYYRSVPGAEDLRVLSRDYQMLRAHAPDPPASDVPGGAGRLPPDPPASDVPGGAGVVGLNLDDPLDRALADLSRGEEVEVAPPGPDAPLFAHYVRALWAGQHERHEEAVERYQWVLDHCPERYDLKAFLGFHAFQLGRFELAEQAWLESLAGAVQPLTLAFLGYLYQHRGEWQLAADFFGAAAELEPEQPLHRQRQQQSLQRLLSP